MAVRVCRKLQSTSESVDVFCREQKKVLQRNYSKSDRFAIELLLRETLLNAVLHGNCEDVSKTLLVECYFGVRKARLRVTDEGKGFDWQRHFKKMSRFSNTSGRGLAILKLYATKVAFNDSGNSVTLERRVHHD